MFSSNVAFNDLFHFAQNRKLIIGFQLPPLLSFMLFYILRDIPYEMPYSFLRVETLLPRTILMPYFICQIQTRSMHSLHVDITDCADMFTRM
jgi:hypothetical protein